MLNAKSITRPIRVPNPYALGALVIGGLFFLPHVLLQLFAPVQWWLIDVAPGVATVTSAWDMLTSLFVLGYFWPYMLICISVLLLTALALWRRPLSRWMAVVLMLILASMAWFAFAPYTPALSAAPGYEMVVPTLPSPLLSGLKNTQARGEVKPCAYELLGWQGETFFYSATCGRGEPMMWFVVPDAAAQPVAAETLPDDLENSITGHQFVSEQFALPRVSPPEAAASVRDLYIRGHAMISPSGTWTAIVASYLYGAEDVVLVKKTE